MRQLIINADDLGMSKEVDMEIEKCILSGVITSTSLIANGPCFDEGVLIAKKYPQISVGVHLNIIEFRPLTNAIVFEKHGMLDQNGCFIDGAAFVVQVDDELQKAIFEEWDAQISKVEDAGILPSHCDSHEHTHTIPALEGVFCRVVDKHKITRVRRKIVPSILLMLRNRKQPIVVHLNKMGAVQVNKRSLLYRRFHLFIVIYNCRHWNFRMKKKYTMTDYFYPFRDFYSSRDILSLGGRDSIVELMCHPGNEPYSSETAALMKSETWISSDYELISYNQL